MTVFPKMTLESFCLLLHGSSERIFKRSAKLVEAANKQAVDIPVSPFPKVLKEVKFSGFVEWIIL